jgi:hypothetical protein
MLFPDLSIFVPAHQVFNLGGDGKLHRLFYQVAAVNAVQPEKIGNIYICPMS